MARLRPERAGQAEAVLAAVLEAIGIYGVIAYDVSQRTSEIGLG